jgi:putative peptide zinc metalloprotease protein
MTSDRPSAGTGAIQLPRLRSELEVEFVAGPDGGFPAAIVTDPVRNRYYRLTWPESAVVLHWQSSNSLDELHAALASHYGLVGAQANVEAVAAFAVSNQLVVGNAGGDWQRYASIDAASQHGLIMRMVHGYLFFRVPLLKPERFLRALAPRFSFVFTRNFWLALVCVAAFALYLAQHQWDAIVAAFTDALRLEGLHIYAAAVILLKAIHELGHGLTTVRYGCRVPSMGIAVIVGAPVLYTDTSDSWRLAKRSERMTIVFAGVAAELVVATVALSLWVIFAGWSRTPDLFCACDDVAHPLSEYQSQSPDALRRLLRPVGLSWHSELASTCIRSRIVEAA